jgi:hypothetical protein
MSGEWTPAKWKKFVATYIREMSTPAATHLLRTLAGGGGRTPWRGGGYSTFAPRSSSSSRSTLRWQCDSSSQ